MITWGPLRRAGYGAWIAIGLGFLAGALEAVWLAASSALPLSFGSFVLVGLVSVLVMGGVSGLIGLGTGAVHLALRSLAAPRAIAWHLGAVGLFLVGWYLWQIAWGLYADGRMVAAVVIAVMPPGFGGVVYFNAGYWLRKVEIGKTYPVPWNAVAFLASAVLVLGGAGVYQARYTGGGALEGDPSVVLITVDTLRRDHVAVYGYEVAPPTPYMDGLAAEGTLFLDAVAPMPETAPSHASMLTGLHPLRHQVISNGHTLHAGVQTVAEVLADEGYATGAFVSSVAVAASTGLDRGFLTFDDGFGPVPGLDRILVVRWAARAWLVLGRPELTPWLYERRGERTVASYERWLDRHGDQPFFAWVHLFEPHAPYESCGLDGFPVEVEVDHRSRMAETEWTDAERASLRQRYREEVACADALVGRVLASLSDRGLDDEVLVILAGDHGESLGEHGHDFHHLGLYDEVVRVPLIARIPGVAPGRVEAQVRLMDVGPTLLEFLGIEGLRQADGQELLSFARGERDQTMWCPLVGRASRSFSDGVLAGLRNNGVKYIHDLSTGEEELYDLRADPAELVDVSDQQAEAIEQIRQLMAPEEAALRGLVEVEATRSDEAAMLELLGYQE